MKQKNETQFELEIRRRVEAKYDERNALVIHLISYAGVNVLVWLIWLFADGAGGFPWPLFVSFFWGIGMAGHSLDYYNKHGGGAQKREDRIQEEVQRHLERLAEREREIYGDDEMDDVERRHARLSDDGELVHLEGLPEEDADGERKRNA